MRMLIIGGVAAGMSAASKIRRVKPDAQIVVLEKGNEVSYGACGLPYYVAGLNDDANRMRIRRAESFIAQGIDVRLRHHAMRISVKDKTVWVRDLETDTLYVEPYDKLLIATGAEAIVPPFPGKDLRGVHCLKTLEDGIRLKEAIAQAHHIAVIGGGYIGVEVAESLRETGREVRLIEAAPRILAPFDVEIAEKLHAAMTEAGISVHTNERLSEVLSDSSGCVSGIKTTTGEYLADIVVMALGVRPATQFVQDTGIQCMPNGAIMTDRYMCTNLPDIYAAGDCAAVYSCIEEALVYSALGTVANKCGRIAGENMAGGHTRFHGCLGSSAISVCGLEAGRTGLGEERARELYGENVTALVIESHDRPPYYPDATPLWVKLICEKRSRRILGGQVAGQKGAVLRVDALAVAITSGMTAPELGGTDLCYAPPFAEVWDALNIAGNAVK